MTRTCDAVVVGAGIAGVASAYFLQRRGFSVRLIDKKHPGWAASGRNPGFLWLQTKAAGPAMSFSLAARRFAEEFAAGLPDFGFRACSGLIVYRDASVEPVARAFVDDRCKAGLPVELLDRQSLLELCPQIGPEVSGAVWNPLDAHQDTRALIRILAERFAVDGGELVIGEVQRIVMRGSQCRGVELATGETIESAMTVIAAGPWSNSLLAPLGLAIPYKPVRFEAAETAPAPFRIGPIVSGQALFRFFTPPGTQRDSLPRDATELIAPDLGFTEQIASYPDGSLQFGCAYEIGSDSDQPTVAGQAMACAILSRNFPGIARLPVTRIWAGIVAQTPDALPVIDAGCGPEGLIVNSGHFFGNLAGPFSGSIIAALAAQDSPALDLLPLSLRRFPRPRSG